MDRLIVVVAATNHELHTHLRDFGSNEIVLNTSTGEMRRGPGKWADIKPLARTVTADVTVRAVLKTSVTVATALNDGDTFDGLTLATGDKVLLMGQSAPSANGIYTVAATPARTPEFNSMAELAGVVVKVTAGTYAGHYFACDNYIDDELGTDDIVFARTGLGPLTLDGNSPLDAVPAEASLNDLMEFMIQNTDGTIGRVTLAQVMAYILA